MTNEEAIKVVVGSKPAEMDEAERKRIRVERLKNDRMLRNAAFSQGSRSKSPGISRN
jgi:hypothetical protein